MSMQMQLTDVEKIIDYTFRDKSLLKTAFTHASFSNEHNEENNEKLEFLGDSVLNFVIAELLYLSAMKDEGAMTASRASIVSREPLANAVEKLGLLNYIRLGAGVPPTKNWSTKSKSNIFEAVLGAIYLDGGMEKAKHFVYNQLGRDIAYSTIVDYKSRLQEYKQAKYNTLTLEYKTEDNGQNIFVSKVYLGDELIGEGKGKKKKLAERDAAYTALKNLNVI